MANEEIGDVLAGLMSNPEALSRAVSALRSSGILSDAAKAASSSPAQKEEVPPTDASESLVPVTASESGGDRSTALLSALRPFVAPERRERIDRLLRLLRLIRLAEKTDLFAKG